MQFLLHNGFSESQLPQDILISRGYFLGDDIEEEMLREQKISWEEPLPRSTESLLCQLPCKSTCLWAGTLYFHSQLSQVFFGTLQSIEIQKSGIFLLKWQLFAALFETTELRASSAPWHGCAWGGGGNLHTPLPRVCSTCLLCHQGCRPQEYMAANQYIHTISTWAERRKKWVDVEI